MLSLMALVTATVWIALFLFVKATKGETADPSIGYVIVGGGRVAQGWTAMIRREQQGDGTWQGSSGELIVATVTRDDDDKERWLWTIAALKRPKGWRKGAGHRASWLEARGAADEYWNRWLTAAALSPISSASRNRASRRRAGRRRRRRRRSAAPKRDPKATTNSVGLPALRLVRIGD
jgi:hypothetical protein